MNGLEGLLFVSGVCTLLFGIGTTIWPVEMFGFTGRQGGIFVIIAALLAMGLGQIISVLGLDAPTEAAVRATALAEAQAAAPSKALHNVRTDVFSWQKVGKSLKVTVVIHNDNDFAVKDLFVTCRITNSGTKIGGNIRRVYERVEPRSYVSVANMDIGSIQMDVASPNCEVTGLEKG